MTERADPWAALIALCVGFFMILLDTTIVSIAIPSLVRGLETDLNAIVWVVSVYLLTYACRCCSPAGSATGSARSACTSPGSRCSRSRRCGADWPAPRRC